MKRQSTIEIGASGSRQWNPFKSLPRRARGVRRRAGPKLRERWKVLMVEDDVDLAMALGIRLREQGFEVTYAKNRVEAIKLALQERPDAIVLDLGLPDGTGYHVMQIVRSDRWLMGVPIFVVSGWDERVNEPQAQRFGIERYFTKPVDGRHLTSAIREVLE